VSLIIALSKSATSGLPLVATSANSPTAHGRGRLLRVGAWRSLRRSEARLRYFGGPHCLVHECGEAVPLDHLAVLEGDRPGGNR